MPRYEDPSGFAEWEEEDPYSPLHEPFDVEKIPEGKWQRGVYGENPFLTSPAGETKPLPARETPAIGGRPPAGYKPPDYSDREGFENFAFEQAGGKWFEIDPYEEVKKADAKIPELFNYAFGGKVVWSDRDKLTKQEKEHWDWVLKSYHADTFNRAKAKRESMKEAHNFMMTRFDNDKKEHEAKLKRYQDLTFKMATEERGQRGEARAERGEKRVISKEETQKVEGAYKRINDINTKMATLEKTDILTALIAEGMPNLQGMIGQKMDPKLKQKLFVGFEREKRYWEQFLPPEGKGAAGKSNLESFKSKWGL